MQLTGTVHRKFETITKNTFTSTEVWIKVPDEKYPQFIKIECIQSKAGLFDAIALDSDVTCEINLKGNIVNYQGADKCFTKLECWKVTVNKAATPAQQYNGVTGYAEKVSEEKQPEDDLPF